MEIKISENEISEAITEYLSNKGISFDNKIAEVEFTAGRGVNGNTATITFIDPGKKKEPNLSVVDDSTPELEDTLVDDTDDDAIVFNT